MMLAVATIHPAAHGLQYYACLTILVAAAGLMVLFAIYWLFRIWEEEERVAHYRRVEHERASGQPGAHGVTRPTTGKHSTPKEKKL